MGTTNTTTQETTVALQDTITQPVLTELEPHPWQACDAHESGAIQALVAVLLPTGGQLLLCSHCARKHFQYTGFGFHVSDGDRNEGVTKT